MEGANYKNLMFEILHTLINHYYPQVLRKEDNEKYIKHIAIHHLLMFNNNIMKINKIEDIVVKDKEMEKNKSLFFDLVNKTKEIIKKENFTKPYLEKDDIKYILKKYTNL